MNSWSSEDGRGWSDPHRQRGFLFPSGKSPSVLLLSSSTTSSWAVLHLWKFYSAQPFIKNPKWKKKKKKVIACLYYHLNSKDCPWVTEHSPPWILAGGTGICVQPDCGHRSAGHATCLPSCWLAVQHNHDYCTGLHEVNSLMTDPSKLHLSFFFGGEGVQGRRGMWLFPRIHDIIHVILMKLVLSVPLNQNSKLEISCFMRCLSCIILNQMLIIPNGQFRATQVTLKVVRLRYDCMVVRK